MNGSLFRTLSCGLPTPNSIHSNPDSRTLRSVASGRSRRARRFSHGTVTSDLFQVTGPPEKISPRGPVTTHWSLVTLVRLLAVVHDLVVSFDDVVLLLTSRGLTGGPGRGAGVAAGLALLVEGGAG